jgi:hypothetical protein
MLKGNVSLITLHEMTEDGRSIKDKAVLLSNLRKNETEILFYLESDGMNAFRYGSDNHELIPGSYELARIAKSDSIKLCYTSHEVKLKDEDKHLIIRYPSSTNHSSLIHRNISRNVTFKEGIYTYKTDSIVSESGFGFGTGGKNGYDKFRFSWFVPGNIEIISYKSNRPGSWVNNGNGITFTGEKGINNVLFEISYRLKNVPSKELEKTKVELKETLTLTDKKAKLSIWDNNVEDGDIISLSLNGEWIIRNLEVKKCKSTFYVDLDQGENFLVMKAENIGTKPPNTAAFLIESTAFSKELILNSDYGKSEMIQINVK